MLVWARLPSEQKWYALTGRIVDAKVEADGDIHLALQDADGKNIGTVSAEIQLAQNGMRFDKLCSAGRPRSSHSQSRACTTLQLPSMSSRLLAMRLRHRRRARRSFKPTAFAERLRCWEIHPVIKLEEIQ